MNALFVLFIVIFIFAGLFFSLYFLIKFMFLSVQEGIDVNLSDLVLSSPPGVYGDNGVIFISVLFSAIISVVIIILGAAWRITRGTKVLKT